MRRLSILIVLLLITIPVGLSVTDDDLLEKLIDGWNDFNQSTTSPGVLGKINWTHVNNANNATGKVGSAIDVTGTKYLSRADLPVLDQIRGNFTLVFWAYRTSLNDVLNDYIFSKGVDYNNNNEFALQRLDGSSRAIMRGSTTDGASNSINVFVSDTTPPAFPSNVWVFYVFGRNYTTGRYWSYINGTSKVYSGTDDTGFLFNGNAAMTLAGGYTSSVNTNFDGYISGLLLFNNSLTTAEILYLYNGGAGRRLAPTPPTPPPLGSEVYALYPISGSAGYQQNFTYLINATYDNCSLYTNTSTVWMLNQTDYSPTSYANNTFDITQFHENGDTIHWGVQCQNITGVFSSTNSSFILDIVAPYITINPNNEFNTDQINPNDIYDDLVKLNITFTDDQQVFAYLINITKDSTTYYSSSATGLSLLTYNFTAVVNATTWGGGVYNAYVAVADAHTVKEIKPYDYLKKVDALEFKTAEGNSITIKSPNAKSSNAVKSKDRYSFEFSYDVSKTDRVYEVISDKPITYMPKSEYSAHFVILHDGINGNWVDFEGLGKQYTVTKINDKHYKVTFPKSTASKSETIKFNSLGGLNTYEANYTFYLGKASLLYDPIVITGTTNNYYLNLTKDDDYVRVNDSRRPSTMTINGTTYNGTATGSANHILWSFSVPGATTTTNLTLPFTINYTVFQKSTLPTPWLTNTTNHRAGNQTFVPLVLGSCGVGLNNVTLRYYLYDEVSLKALAQDTYLKTTINAWIGDGNKESTLQVFNVSFTGNPPYDICLSPVGVDLQIDAILEFGGTPNNPTAYEARHYYHINQTVNSNQFTRTNLYLINTSTSDNAFFFILDQNDRALSGSYVKALRYYVDEDLYKVVQIEQADTNGQVRFRLTPFTALYQFIIQDYTTTLKTTDRAPILTTPYNIRVPVGAAVFNDYRILSGLVTSLTNESNTYTYSFNSGTGTPVTATIEVLQKTVLGTTTVCSSSDTNTAGSVSCNIVPSGDSEYTIRGMVNVDSTIYQTQLQSYTTQDAYKTVFGGMGVLLSFMVLAFVALLGVWAPALSALFMIVAMVLLKITGLLMFTPLTLGYIILIALFLAWRVAR